MVKIVDNKNYMSIILVVKTERVFGKGVKIIKMQFLKNKSDYELYLNGIGCYMCVKRSLFTKRINKSDFNILIKNKPNFIVLLNNDTVKKYKAKFEDLGFRVVEEIPYNSFETQIYCECV